MIIDSIPWVGFAFDNVSFSIPQIKARLIQLPFDLRNWNEQERGGCTCLSPEKYSDFLQTLQSSLISLCNQSNTEVIANILEAIF